MARLLYIIVLTSFLLILVDAQQTNGSVSVGASLTATDGVMPWLSPSGDFSFGFQQIQGKDNFVLSIWYDKIPDKTIVWYPQTNPTVSRGSKVVLTNGSGLVLSDPQGRELWTSGTVSDLSYGYMNDTGNFVLVRSDSSKLWESFNFPSDTLLPTQMLERGEVIYSKLRNTNFSRGRFQLRMLQTGDLVLNSRDISSDYAYKNYYNSDTSDLSNPSNSGQQMVFDSRGYMYILRVNGQRFNLTPREAVPSGDYYHRATLGFDGVFTQYYHPKNSYGNITWSVSWLVPAGNICQDMIGREGSGACGFNNVCSLGDDNRPKCECPQGLSLLDPSDPYGDCKLNYTPSCDEGESSYGRGFDFIELASIDWPQADYVHMDSTSVEDCKSSCLDDCLCAVAVHNGNECWKKKLPLSNGWKNTSIDTKVFLKFQKDELPTPSPHQFPRGKKDGQKTLITVGSSLLGSSVFLNIVLIGVTCFGFFLNYKKKASNRNLGDNAVETNLIYFTYKELFQATNGFKDELGKGSFGIVYKGVIGTNMVAVKKLNRVVEDGEKEFKTEVNAIARTHHKNLVQLLGCCEEGEHRLLVYEYMSNGTLASFLFRDERPEWKQRIQIALGIAKALSYLHEECTIQIIHCDIKPQNILLNEKYNACISDFGLAKLLVMNQSRTTTGIRGTKGYVAPEWFRNAAVTIKVDVYSFGVLLLEIISCRKSVERFESGNENESNQSILTDWAWDCYQDGKLDVLVENDSEAMDDYKRLKTFVMVALWCVQENPSLRPTMRRVIQMLEGVVQVTQPPCPYPFSVTSS